MKTRLIFAFSLSLALFVGCNGSNSSNFAGDIDETGCDLSGNTANSARVSASASCTAPNPIFNDPGSDFKVNDTNPDLAGAAGSTGQNLPDYLKNTGGINSDSNFGWGNGQIPFGNLSNVNDPALLAAVLSGPYGPMVKTLFGDIETLPTDWLARLQKWIRDGRYLPSALRLRLLAVGNADPSSGQVKVYRINSAKQPVEIASFRAFPSGGVNVALADVTGDGIADLVVGHASQDSDVIIFRGVISGPQGMGFVATSRFTAYPGFGGGVYVATGDINGDGKVDIITGAGYGGGPHVKVFSGASNFKTTTHSYYAYDSNFRGGVRVAAGDVSGDHIADIITAAGKTGGPHIRTWRGVGNSGTPTSLKSYYAYDANFRGGVYVAAADYDNDGRADILTGAGETGGPHVKIFSGRNDSTLMSEYAYASNLTHGVAVAGGYIFKDRSPALVTGPASEANSSIVLYSWEKGTGLKREAELYNGFKSVSLSVGVSY